MTTTMPAPPRRGRALRCRQRPALRGLSADLSRYRLSRDTWTLIVFGIAALAALLSVVGMGIALNAGGDKAAAGQSITAELSEFAITLSSAQIDSAGTLTVHNGGTMAHDLQVTNTDLSTGSLDPAVRRRST